MKKTLLIGAGLAALLANPATAWAQRTDENAVESAQDAFGTSVGNERVGLYFPQSARGFSPIQAGNVRINGMYFDYQADFNDRLISGSNVRVGLTAQGYPFPAPTGVADFSLRLPGSEAVASTVVGIGPFGGPRVEVDAQLPISGTLGIAGGAGLNDAENHYGGDQHIVTAAAIARWRPADNVEIIPFWSMKRESGAEAMPIIGVAMAAATAPARMREVFMAAGLLRFEMDAIGRRCTRRHPKLATRNSSLKCRVGIHSILPWHRRIKLLTMA